MNFSDETELELRKLANTVYEDPQSIIKGLVMAVFICKTLVLVWSFRLSDMGDAGFLLGLGVIATSMLAFDWLIKLLKELAETTRVEAPSSASIAFMPVTLALLLRVLESSSVSGRTPIVSVIIDLSLLLTAFVGGGIYTANYACQKYPQNHGED